MLFIPQLLNSVRTRFVLTGIAFGLFTMLRVALVDSGLVKNESIDTGLFGKISVSSMGLPLFTLAIGLLDGFNPCAMWVLLFLLSMLVHLKSRARMALIAGTFIGKRCRLLCVYSSLAECFSFSRHVESDSLCHRVNCYFDRCN